MQLLLVAVAGLFVDQFSKAVVARHAGKGPISLCRFLQIRVVNNVTINRRIGRLMVVVWILAGASILLLVGQRLYFDSTIARIGLGLALGGAAGNLFDRLARGHIIDFIEIGFWPVFNVADVAIVVGLPLAFLHLRTAA
jgi:signal peptidase II